MKNRIFIYSLLIIGILSLLSVSCKKKDENGNPTPTPTPGIVTDIDGNVYHSVTIGNQVWMVENLKTTKFNDGSSIPLVEEGLEWYYLSSPGFCWYNNDASTYKNSYGALYNWYAVNTGKLAPQGWHVPSDAEWETLIIYLGGESEAGGKMKESGILHWVSPNEGATNSSGFTGLPGGGRDVLGSFYFINFCGYWWSSTPDVEYNAWLYSIGYNYAGLDYFSDQIRNGLSVRCVKD